MGRGGNNANGETARATTRGESIKSIVNRYSELRPKDGWTCDGGAAVLSDMLSRAGVEHRLRIGLYAPKSSDEEHHHWVEVGEFEHEHTLIDPNAGIRGEKTLAPIDEAVREKYMPRDDIGSMGDREVMAFSPLWDPDEEEILSVEDLVDHHDPGVAGYLEALRSA